MRKTAAQLTATLPMTLPRASRHLTKPEREIASRAIDTAWGCRASLSAPEYVMLLELRRKLAASIGYRSRFSDREKQLLIRLIDVLWQQDDEPLHATEFSALAEIQAKLTPAAGREVKR